MTNEIKKGDIVSKPGETDTDKNAPVVLTDVPAYVVITDAEIVPGKPGSGQLMTKLRDNAISMQGGGIGAPKIENEAFAVSTIGSNKILLDDTVSATTIAAGQTLLIPQGFYIAQLGWSGSTTKIAVLEANAPVFGWATLHDNRSASENLYIHFFSDGINYRARNDGGVNQTLDLRRTA